VDAGSKAKRQAGSNRSIETPGSQELGSYVFFTQREEVEDPIFLQEKSTKAMYRDLTVAHSVAKPDLKCSPILTAFRVIDCLFSWLKYLL